MCKCSPLFLVCTAVMSAGVVLAEGAELELPPRMDRSKLNVGTYFLQSYARTEEHVKDLADCGIDFVVCMSDDRKTLDLFQKFGVGAIVTGILPGWWGGDGSNAGQMESQQPLAVYEKALAGFVDHPAIWGIDTGDEPSALDFPHYGRIFRFMQSKFTDKFPYLNLYPNYASVAQNNEEQTVNQLGTATYAGHIARYCEEVDADYLCYDFYMYAAGIPGHYDNLCVVSDACRKSGRSMWIVLQVNSSDPTVWISENQLRAQAYSAMAFGAETIIWACYTAGWWHNQVLDETGARTRQYEKLKTINRELHLLGDEYMKFRNVSTHFIGFPKKSPWLHQAQQDAVQETLSTAVFQNVRGNSLIAGQMAPRQFGGRSRALMLFAADDPKDTENRRQTVTFHCDRKNVSCIGASLQTDGQGNYVIDMLSNAGVLLVAE